MTDRQHSTHRVIPLPVGRAASYNASVFDRALARVRVAIGRTLATLGVPGAVAPIVAHDGLTGTELSVHVGPLFTRITVNGRDHYFDRFTGRYDGTGSGCS